MTDTSSFFDQIFQHARHNAILLMSPDGMVDKVNQAFTSAFGYTTEDLKEKHFRQLYIEKDKITRKPELELNQVQRTGVSSDENYLVHKDGTPIWVTGEAILIKTEKFNCIAKIIHNIHAQKQLERYLMSSQEVLNNLFESVQQKGLLLLNGQMKVQKSNPAFCKMFGIATPPEEGSRIQDISHPLWQKPEIREALGNALVNGVKIDQDFIAGNEHKDVVRYHFFSKMIISDDLSDKSLLLIIRPE